MITMVEMNRVRGVVWSVGCPWSGGLMPVECSVVCMGSASLVASECCRLWRRDLAHQVCPLSQS